ATISFTFSEATTNFVDADILVTGGTLGTLSSADNITYTATLTPTAVAGGSATINVANNTYTDADGNNGTGDSLLLNVVNAAPNAIDDNGTVYLTGGLLGSYYAYEEGQDGGNLENLNIVRDFIDNNSADAYFIASDLDYIQVNDGLGKHPTNNSNTNLQTFLGGSAGDAASLSSIPEESSDGILHFKGRIDLAAGDYKFKVNADDGYTILIDGVAVATVFEKQDITETIHNSFTVANGSNGSLHDIEIIYWDQGEKAVLQVELTDEVSLPNNDATYYTLENSTYPMSRAEGYSANKGEVFTVNTTTLLANDTDAENDMLTVVRVGNPSDGASVSLDNGIVTLTPATGFSGFATFEYTVSDGTDTSTATVTVEYFNEFSAEDDRDIVTLGNQITGNVITGDGGDGTGADELLSTNATVSSVDFNGSNYTADTNGDITIVGYHGTLVLMSDGAYTYSANPTAEIIFGDTSDNTWSTNKASWDKTELYGFTGGTAYFNTDNGINNLAIDNANVSRDGNTTPNLHYAVINHYVEGNNASLGINEDNSIDGVNEFFLIDRRNDLAEALAVKLPSLTNMVNVNFGYVDADDQVTWIVYDENLQQVGSGITNNNQQGLTVTVDGSTVTSEFSYILFTAGDNTDDYGIDNISYTPAYVEDVFTYSLTNDNGDADTATLTITQSQQGTANGDMLTGTSNDDVINGLGGEDNISGNAGDDILSGGDGIDTISGGTGNDNITGGADGDSINGNAGDDIITGGTGIDNISGDDGDDSLTGGVGNDFLTGGSGIDTFIWLAGDSGVDEITDFTVGEDVIDISDILQISDGENLNEFLDFESDGTDTTLSIYADGGNTVTQTIVLDNVDLGSNDVTIINDMLTGVTNGGSLFIGDSSLVDTLVIQAIADETD
ncbi:Ig-like domain-containing protein, partial [Colwelliaceae bacterium MEBiC 14330]